MTPYHVQVKSTNGIPSWELYYRLPGGWRLRFEREGEVYESDVYMCILLSEDTCLVIERSGPRAMR